jgi:hypothetical protein
MANAEHMKVLDEGVASWNRWRLPGMQGHYEIDHLISLELGGSNVCV